MKLKIKLLILAVILLTLTILVYNDYNIQGIDTHEDTIIVSMCTGDMRALETGISVYAGYNHIPLILTDRTMPPQLSDWIGGYVKQNNIKHIIIVGPVDAKQLLQLQLLGVEVKHVNGNSIADILTKIAENTSDKNNDTVIFTSSDPTAGMLGAYTKTPVFITATNSTYTSANSLDDEYAQYLEKHDIKNIIIVGSLPEELVNQLKEYNATITTITGKDTLEVSMNVNNYLRSAGYLENTSTAYYGYFGELPTITPLAVKENAMMIEDASNNGDMMDYLKENNITTVYITRNTKSSYIQMEEADYISTQTIKNLEENNITVKYLTRERTLDEATGLYDVKIITAENMQKEREDNNTTSTGRIDSQYPPLIAILEGDEFTDSNNITAKITRNPNDTYTVKWSTIHPYTWTKTDYGYHATSNTGYEYQWIDNKDKWLVNYIYNNTTYYNTTWIRENNTWKEIQEDENYTWAYDGNDWYCYHEDKVVYYLKKL